MTTRGALGFLRSAFLGSYVLLNVLGLALGRAEAGHEGPASLPMNLTLTARKPLRA